jgi:hypothetical protein
MKEHEQSHWGKVPQAPDLYEHSNRQREKLASLHEKSKTNGLQYEEEKTYRRLKKAHGDPSNEAPGA